MTTGHSRHLVLAGGIAAALAVATPVTAAPGVGTITPFTGNISATACANPEGLTIDLLGNFYIGSAATLPTGTICQLSPHGAIKKTISIPPGPGQLVSLLGLHFEGTRTVFALDFADTLAHPGATNGRVLAVDAVSGVVKTLASGFSFPNGIAEDLQGNLYVTDSFQGTITRLAQDGSHKTVWSSDPLLAGNPAAPLPIGANGIAFDLFFQNVYVAVTSQRRIVRIPVGPGGGAGAAQVVADGPTIDASQHTTNALLGADGIAFDLAGNLYVAANANAEIQVLSPSAHLVARYTDPSLPIDVPASPLFVGNKLFFTNLSLFDGGVNSSVAVLRTPLPGLPPL